jgi:hypothetical protein
VRKDGHVYPHFALSDEDMAALDGLDLTAGTDRALERPW